MPTHFIGVDFHKATSYLSVLDQFGQQVKSGGIANDRAELEQFLAPYQDACAVMEAGRNWTLMYDWLEQLTQEVTLAHPLKVKAIAAAKVKTDKIDAKVLAHLLRTDLLPAAHVPSENARSAREILRQRMFYVRLATMVKNRIRTVVDRHPEFPPAPAKLLFAELNRPWFAALPLAERERHVIDQDRLLLDDLKTRIHESDRAVSKIFKGSADARLLKTIPGIGIFFATLVASEIDDIHRFPNPKKLAAYAGLVPSTYSSGPRTFHGRITKQGNKFLRWAFVEAVWPALKKKDDPGLRHYYFRIKSKKGHNSAKVATARRLLAIAYCVLREHRPYESRLLPPAKASDQVSA